MLHYYRTYPLKTFSRCLFIENKIIVILSMAGLGVPGCPYRYRPLTLFGWLAAFPFSVLLAVDSTSLSKTELNSPVSSSSSSSARRSIYSD